MNWKEINPPKDYDDEDFIYMGRAALASRRVNQAVNNGNMVRADRCEVCGKKTKTHGHHWNGHENWFDVWWVCQRCNNALKIHDGSLSLEDARKIIVGRYFKRIEHYQKWKDRQDGECSACGVSDKVGNMVVVYDHYDEDFILCQHCWDQSFAAAQQVRAADVAVCTCNLDEWITELVDGKCSRCKLPRR